MVFALRSVFCTDFRIDSDLCHLHHKRIGFYYRGGKSLQRGTDWVFKYSSLRFVFKRLMSRRNVTFTDECAVFLGAKS